MLPFNNDLVDSIKMVNVAVNITLANTIIPVCKKKNNFFKKTLSLFLFYPMVLIYFFLLETYRYYVFSSLDASERESSRTTSRETNPT